MSGKLISYDVTCRINREHISNCEQNTKLFESLAVRTQTLTKENYDIMVIILNNKL